MSNITSGINAGSNAAGYEEFIIFAIDDQSGLGVNQFINWLINNNISHKRLIGDWEGTIEASYIVSLKDWNETIAASNFTKGQHSILHLGKVDNRGYRDASIVWLQAAGYRYGEVPTNIGKFMQVSAELAQKYAAWTYDLESKSYYVGLNTPARAKAA